MSISELRGDDFCNIIIELSKNINFDKDLPFNIIGNGFDYWFFERPLLACMDLFLTLVSASYSCFDSDVLIKFSGKETIDGSCIVFDGKNISKDIEKVSSGFDSFFGGKVSYPMILFNRTYDWIAFESVYEELGVIGVRNRSVRFTSILNDNFISCDALRELAQGNYAESETAKFFQSSYCRK